MVVATYGEGEPTDNAVQFSRWLKEDADAGCLSGMKFTVMGLGNTQYALFNAMGVLCEEKFQALGAEVFYPRGVGNDAEDIEQDFQDWRDGGLMEKLQAVVSGDSGATRQRKSSMSADVPTPDDVLKKLSLEIALHPTEKEARVAVDASVHDGGASTLEKFFCSATRAKVSKVYQLRQQADLPQGLSTVHVDLDCTGTGLTYQTADNANILPENPPELVQWFAEKLGVVDQLGSYMSFKKGPHASSIVVKKPWRAPCTVEEALRRYLDLSLLPPKRVLAEFCAFLTSESEHSILLALLRDDAALKALRAHDFALSFREFWDIYLSSIQIDISVFLQICLRQTARPYTISSSAQEHPSVVGVTVSMVRSPLDKEGSWLGKLKEMEANGLVPAGGAAKLEASRKYDGITSTWLSTRLKAGDEVLVKIAASSFRLPKDATKPVAMVAAGTGIAPMRAFLREFSLEKQQQVGKKMLFFGCQHKERDFLYKDEIQETLDKGVLTAFIPAFSRMQEKKVYVQHKLKEHGDEVKQLFADKGVLYICGANAMGNDVYGVLRDLGLNVEKLKKDKRIIEELWG